MGNFVFDKTSYVFRYAGRTLSSVLLSVLHVLLFSVVFSVVLYVVIALLVSTDEERRLRKEIKIYEQVFPEMEEHARLIGDVIEGLQLKDDNIYGEIFHTVAPEVDPINSLAFLPVGDSISSRHIIDYAAKKSIALMDVAVVVEDDFKRIFEKCESGSLPPLSLPANGVSYAQVGASTGERVNPFFKVGTIHEGIDIIVPQGDPVFATLNGVVTDVQYSRKGHGNMVVVSHAGGFVTKYAHLADIEVRRGQVVKKGQKLGYVGISGNSFAPHLHYEVVKDSLNVDPVNYFFASVSPDEYANMVYMSVHTEQSMD